MLIIRPYGNSRSERNEDKSRRVLYDKSADRTRHEIVPFANSHDELVIAQWISTIDKIATKPHRDKGATKAQRTLRDKLGKAAWQRLIEDQRIQGDEERMAYLRELWNFKIHPYGNIEYPSLPLRGGNQMPKPMGRWYRVFAGDVSVEDVDPVQVAERISRHLYDAEYRMHPGLPNRRTGKIEARAESIALNVLSERKPNEVKWGEKDLETYNQPGDVAKEILKKAIECEEKNHVVRLNIAAACLFNHWAKIFRNPATGAVLGIEDAKKLYPALFALHLAVKETYTRALKHHRKNTKDHRKKDRNERKLSDILPKDMEELLRLNGAQKKNTDLAALVRLGKVLHYTASGDNTDTPDKIDTNWPVDVSASRFWTSEGQAEIKRAEAFVRVWRHVLTCAGLTLRDWASMKVPFKEDILGGGNAIDQATGKKNYDRGKFERKVELLFGNRAQIFSSGTDDDLKYLLRAAIKGTANLRHRTFHFKGRSMFLDGLRDLPGSFSGQPLLQVRSLWKADASECTARLKARLRAAHVEFFFDDSQNQRILDLIAPQSTTDLPLPRFSRILLRAENAWSKHKDVRLPNSANQRALEAPARMCQYTVLKLLYERPFRSWLESQKQEALRKWIDKAIARTTQAARELNGKGSEENRKFIAARAESLPKPKSGGGIREFFFDLSSATASEMRVQRGYESDGEKACEQAGYIDDFLCDVLILALTDYIAETRLGWLLDLNAALARPEEPACNIDPIPTPDSDVSAEDWQVILYFILHLIPVDDVSKLLHQINKWEITASGVDVPPDDETRLLHRLQSVMKLYLNMHDAKFEGGAALKGCNDFRDFFESDAGFNRVFPSQLTPDADQRIPRRGLREIMRFGNFSLLQKIRPDKITDEIIDKVMQAEKAEQGGLSEIAHLQQKREDLHEKWVKKKQLEADDLRGYCEALATISRHRHDAAQINLTDYVRIHRLIMAVLGRLVDYAGLFERDLYFVTLGLIHRHRLKPTGFFNCDGLALLKEGRILAALKESKGDCASSNIQKEISHHFGEVCKSDKNCPTSRDIRNHLAHLNMLQPDDPIPNLTHLVNQTRHLMAYDRKLKNAVSQSICELLAREGIGLRWQMSLSGNRHLLAGASVETRSAKHLGGKKFIEGRYPISEALHSAGFVVMVAALFNGRVNTVSDITTLDLSRVDWSKSISKPKGGQKIYKHDAAQRPRREEKSRRKQHKYK